MARINKIKLKTLKQTRNFYLWELKRGESLTEGEKSKYLLALKTIDRIIKEKEELGERGKHNKAIFRRSY
ncbi:unnamed protein product [marine sediment metagenome]|uniref:Uncharacterized protein n=1 Tax=marine sediment metagenome TaxID=412755 RepID=X1V114_9ZZZZ